MHKPSVCWGATLSFVVLSSCSGSKAGKHAAVPHAAHAGVAVVTAPLAGPAARHDGRGALPASTPAASAGAASCPGPTPSGPVRYVCDCAEGASPSCVPGDDGNPGTAPDAPFRSFTKAREYFNAMDAGESIAFCRGGALLVSGDNSWFNQRCKANDRCVVRDYVPAWADANAPAPLIISRSDVGPFGLGDGGEPDHDEGYVFANLSLRGSGSGSAFFFYNEVDDALICNMTVDHFAIGVQIAGANTSSTGLDPRHERIVIRGSRFINNANFGVLGGCDHCAIENSFFDNNGSRPTFDHNVYLDEAGGLGKPIVGMRVVGNELVRSTQVKGVCTGVSLVVHAYYDQLLIENNHVHEPLGHANAQCWGISVDTGYDGPEGFRDLTIRGNRVENVGGIGIGISGCENCLIENNAVLMEQDLVDVGGIAAPVRRRGADDYVMTRVTIRNNSVYIGKGMGVGIALGEEGTQHALVSNVVQAGSGGPFSCFRLEGNKSSYRAVDDNLCSFTGKNVRWEVEAGSLAQWQAASGFDTRSKLAHPGFKSLTVPYDLGPGSAASPMVNQGHKTDSSRSSLVGKPRDAAPDIGAYEW